MYSSITTLILVLLQGVYAEEKPPPTTHCIEGKVTTNSVNDGWLSDTMITVEGGKFHGFPRSNGNFSICDIPPGSYVVEVVSPNDIFEPIRVDISTKSGKIRARKFNSTKPKLVSRLPYPLSFNATNKTQFFTKRESWINFKNPMSFLVICAPALPVLLTIIMYLYSKSIDPEDQKKMQESMFPLQKDWAFPSPEEICTKFFAALFGGGKTQPATAKQKKPQRKKSEKVQQLRRKK